MPNGGTNLLVVLCADNKRTAPSTDGGVNKRLVFSIVALCGVIILAELASVVTLAFKAADDNKVVTPASATSGNGESSPVIIVGGNQGVETAGVIIVTKEVIPTAKPPSGVNICSGKKPDLPDVECVIDAIANVGE